MGLLVSYHPRAMANTADPMPAATALLNPVPSMEIAPPVVGAEEVGLGGLDALVLDVGV